MDFSLLDDQGGQNEPIEKQNYASPLKDRGHDHDHKKKKLQPKANNNLNKDDEMQNYLFEIR